jgi:hypothetical protein
LKRKVGDICIFSIHRSADTSKGKMDPLRGGERQAGFKVSENKITTFEFPRPWGFARSFCSTWDLEGEL